MVAIAEDEKAFHRLFLYRKNGPEDTESIIVDASTAVNLEKGQWELSPFAFLPEDKQTREVEIVVNELCRDLNMLLNLSLAHKDDLRTLAERMFDMKLSPKLGAKAMARRIEARARSEGKWYEDDYDPVTMVEEEMGDES